MTINLESATLNGNVLTITIEDGSSVDVNLSQFMDDTDTDEQELTYTLDNNILTLTIDNGNTLTIDLSNFDNDGTDDQNLDRGEIIDDHLYIGIEEDATGEDLDIDLSPYKDQQIEIFDIIDSTITLQIEDAGPAQTIELGNLLKDAGSDDQLLTIDTNTDIVSLEDGGFIDLTKYLDNTDTQNIEVFTLDPITKQITLTIQDGGTEIIDLAEFINTDTQDIEIFSIDPDTKVITLTIQDGGTETINLSEFINTDEQTLSFDHTNNQLEISNGNSVFLDSLDTDRQQITLFDVDGNDNLVISLERGGSKTIDISKFDNFGTDDQKLDRVN